MKNYNTENKSFLKLAEFLRNKGIKNYDFFLELKNKDLLNVNPRSRKLTKIQKIDILKEILVNKWYFLREIVIIPENDQSSTKYKLNNSSLAIHHVSDIKKHGSIFINSPRMTGVTTALMLETIYNIFTSKYNHNLMINRSYEDNKRYANIMDHIINLLPSWLVQEFSMLKDHTFLRVKNTNFIDDSFVTFDSVLRNREEAIKRIEKYNKYNAVNPDFITITDFTHIPNNDILHEELCIKQKELKRLIFFDIRSSLYEHLNVVRAKNIYENVTNNGKIFDIKMYDNIDLLNDKKDLLIKFNIENIGYDENEINKYLKMYEESLDYNTFEAEIKLLWDKK